MLTKNTLILTFGLFFLISCHEEVAKIEPNKSFLTKLIEVKKSSQNKTVRFPAVIEASEKSDLAFQVPGLINTLNVKEGDEVKEGDLLASLDQRSFTNTYNSVKAAYENAKLDFERAKNLIEENAISKSMFDQRKASFEGLKADFDTAAKTLEDSTIVAPFSGIVSKVHMEKFENIMAQTPALTLLSDKSIVAVVQVPASLIIKSETEQPNKVTFELDAAKGIKIPTVLHEAAAQSDPSTQTFEVRYSLTSPDDLLILPGMTGTLTGEYISTEDTSNYEIKLPISAVVEKNNQTFVWLVSEDTMTVSQIPVDVHVRVNGAISITGDLIPGQKVVSVGGQYLYEGALVRQYNK